MNRFHIEAAAITHIGGLKESNDDNYYINGKYKSDSSISTDGVADKKPRNVYTYAVCDGLGGESYGELASLLAVATLEKFRKTNIRETIKTYIKTVNEYIRDLIQKGKQIACGTTLALLNIQNNTAIVYNIGDSRVYMCRKGDLYLLSSDHADTGRKKDGSLRDEPPDFYLGHLTPERSSILRISDETKVKQGDIFLLCSKGLTNAVSDAEIVEILSLKNMSSIDLSKKLVSAAQENNGHDDVTVIVARLI